MLACCGFTAFVEAKDSKPLLALGQCKIELASSIIYILKQKLILKRTERSCKIIGMFKDLY